MYIDVTPFGTWILKLFIQQNTQKNTKEMASNIEQVFVLWYDKDILDSLIIFNILMNKTG